MLFLCACLFCNSLVEFGTVYIINNHRLKSPPTVIIFSPGCKSDPITNQLRVTCS